MHIFIINCINTSMHQLFNKGIDARIAVQCIVMLNWSLHHSISIWQTILPENPLIYYPLMYAYSQSVIEIETLFTAHIQWICGLLLITCLPSLILLKFKMIVDSIPISLTLKLARKLYYWFRPKAINCREIQNITAWRTQRYN